MSKVFKANDIWELMQRHRFEQGADGSKTRYAYIEWLGIYNALKELPTIDISDRLDEAYACGYTDAEAKWSNPVAHGEWEEKEIIDSQDGIIIEQWQRARCNRCGKYHTTPYMYYFSDYDYCPHCGADMREREGE